MNKLGTILRSGLTLPLAATVVLTACAPQAVQQITQQPGNVSNAVQQVQQAQTLPVGTFTGMVATFDGSAFQPIAGATVQVKGTNLLAVTDSTGSYTINGVTPGMHTAVVTKDGFAKSESPVNLSPVAGTPRVNMALSKAEYGVKAINAFTATVTGVVKDPRGSALPAATVRVVSNAGAGTNQTVVADANGFYTTALAGAAVSPLSPGQVQVTAFGTTPGGVKVEVSAVAAKNLTSASLVVDPICDAFTQPKNFTFPNGTFTPMGQNGTLKSEWISTRADEFYIRLVSGGQQYAVLADTIVNTAATTTAAQNAVITFRVPFTMPTNTFTMQVVPFGISTAAISTGQAFVVSYDATNFEADVAYKALSQSFDDISEPPLVPPNINAGTFVAGEDATYKIALTNNSTDVSQDIRLEGRIANGVQIASVKVTPTANGTVGTAITIPGSNITQPNSSGDWSVTGFSIPARVGINRGESAVEIQFTTPPNLARGTALGLTNLALKMPSAALTKTTPPAAVAGLTVRSIDPAAIQIIPSSKVVSDLGIASDGLAQVSFVIQATNADALGAIRITDTTMSSELTPASSATITGTKPINASPATLGLATSDKIGISIDGGAETVLSVISTSWDLETLCAFISSILNSGPGGTVVTCSRDGNNRFSLIRTQQGTARTLTIGPSTTTGMQTALGIVPGTVAGTNGITAEFTGTGASVTQPGGSNWSFASGANSVHNAGGSLTTNFTIVPPTALTGGDLKTTNITVRYRVVKQAGTALSLGGGGAAMGPRLLAVNLLSPFTLTGKDLALPVNANTDKDDAALVTGL